VSGGSLSHTSTSSVTNRNQGGNTTVNIHGLGPRDIGQAITRARSKMGKTVTDLARHGHLDGALKKYRGR
jgi:hypothetical protein